ncbi:MAG: hypothetical protein ACLGSA_12450 [Acidobacteriota bacterium]
MTLKLTNSGERKMLEALLGSGAVEDTLCKLFTNNVTPAEGDTASTYTEASGGGYAAKALTKGNWTITEADPTEAVYAQQAYTFTGALTTNPTIYGYFIVGATSGTLLWAEKLAQSFTPANNGDVQRVTPKFTLE